MSDAPCSCRKADPWRCAVDLNLRTVACPCECHKLVPPQSGAEAVTQVIDAAAEADMQKMKTLHREVRDLIDRQAEVTTQLEALAKTLNNTIKRAEEMLRRNPTQPVSNKRK